MESKIKNEMEIVDQNTEAVNSPNNREKKPQKR